MLKSAREVIVVTDATKFGKVALAAVAPLKKVHKIVTDSSLDPKIKFCLAELGITVLQA